MKRVNVAQPWAELIACGDKMVVHLYDRPEESFAGEDVEIYATSEILIPAINWLAEQGVRVDEAAMVTDAVVAVAHVRRARWLTEDDREATLCACEGLFGLMLEDVRPTG